MNTNADIFGFNLDNFRFESINKTSLIPGGSISVVHFRKVSIKDNFKICKNSRWFTSSPQIVKATSSYYEISGIFPIYVLPVTKDSK
jgi:hypothetical protein